MTRDDRSGRRTRVLWLAKGLGLGGAERLLVTSAAHIDTSRFDVQIAYLLAYKDAFVPDLQAAGVMVHCLDQRRALDPRWTLQLRRFVRRESIDVVHTHMPVPAVGARLALLGTGVRLVHTEHNVWDRYRRLTYWANAVTYRRNSAVIAVSQAVADTIKPWSAPRQGRVTVVHHGVEVGQAVRDGASSARARAMLGLPPEAFVIGTVGNLTAKKDQATMLAAVARLKADIPVLRLVLVGSGPLETELKEQARRLGISDIVLFTGMRNDVPAILPALDVFCLSSSHEGLSIALVEALLTGLPTVATNVGGLPEVITHEIEGLLVPPADPAAFAAALRRLYDEPASRQAMSLAAVARARYFDAGAATRRIEQIYDTVIPA